MSTGKLQTSKRLEVLWSLIQQTGHVVLVGPLAQNFPEELASRGYPIIGVDGGSNKSASSRYHFTLGDGDSLAAPMKLDVLFPTQKDHSDLALALQHLPKGACTVHLWGFWGGRFDHQMMNLGEAFQWVQENHGQLEFHLEGLYHVTGLPAGKHQLQLTGVFSLFSPQETYFSIEGQCGYPLPRTLVKPFSSQLLSNEGQGQVTITSEAAFFCYRRKA